MLESVAEVCLALSSLVEVGFPDRVAMEIEGSREVLARMGMETEEEVADGILERVALLGHRARVALADDLDTARTFASFEGLRAPPKVTVVPVGASAAALFGLPLSALVWTDVAEDPEGRALDRLKAVHGSLRVLGAESVRHLVSLPAEQVKSRFQDAGALLFERAMGRRRRPLSPHVPKETLLESLELDPPVEDLSPMAFVLKRLFDRLEARLQARGTAASRVELRFVISPDPDRPVDRSQADRRATIELPLARPTRSASVLLRICREQVSASLPGPVARVEIEAKSPVQDSGAQLDLFTRRAREVEKVEELVARLSLMLGERAVHAAELVDTHRPEAAWRARPFMVDVAFAEEPEEPKVSTREVLLVERKGRAQVLPSVADELPKVTIGAESEFVRESAGEDESTRAEVARMRPWPKPVKASLVREPRAPLPLRPLLLLPEPEPAVLLGYDKKRPSPRESHESPPSRIILLWRNERLGVDDIGVREFLEGEWWTREPLEREYLVVTVEDGRRFWLYLDREGSVFVHGLFD